MKNKKGISLLISWVLLIGLSVTLAVFATMWARQYAETSTTKIAEMVVGDMRCDDVAISANYTSCVLTIKNEGYFTIKSVFILINGAEAPSAGEINITESILYDQCASPGDKIELIPIIKSGKEFIGCSDKKITLTG